MSNRTKVLIGGYAGYGAPYREALGEDYTYHAINDPAHVAAFDFAEVYAVVFTGGADIDPNFYGGQMNDNIWCDSGHDALDRALLTAIDAEEDLDDNYGVIYKLGTCRGAQLLFCHYTGGRLIQHIDGHSMDEHVGYIVGNYNSISGVDVRDPIPAHGSSYYPPEDAPGTVSINSIHHQAIDWNSQQSNVCSPSRNSAYRIGNFHHRRPNLLMVGESEGQSCIEAWCFLGKSIVGFQYHPEWMEADSPGYKWSIGAIRNTVQAQNPAPWNYPRHRVTQHR